MRVGMACALTSMARHDVSSEPGCKGGGDGLAAGRRGDRPGMSVVRQCVLTGYLGRCNARVARSVGSVGSPAWRRAVEVGGLAQVYPVPVS